jgi:membrane fusion protein, multidrug efflux system
VNADRTVSVHPVTLGVVDGERVAVAKGLSAGDIVVTEGADRLRDGAQVLLPNAGPAAAAQKPATPAAAGQGQGQGQGQGRHKRPNGQAPNQPPTRPPQ